PLITKKHLPVFFKSCYITSKSHINDMKNIADNLFLTNSSLPISNAVVVRRRRPVKIMELFG
ncbi:MAG: hypothetical protein ACSHWU_03255, partial [Marinicella sp.]